MKRAVIFAGMFYSRQKYRIGIEGTIFYSIAYAGYLLKDGAPGTYIQVAHFRITHLSLGQSHLIS
jgi:hypothetical protein